MNNLRSFLEHTDAHHITTRITYVMWRKEQLRNVSVLRRVHISNLVLIPTDHSLDSHQAPRIRCQQPASQQRWTTGEDNNCTTAENRTPAPLTHWTILAHYWSAHKLDKTSQQHVSVLMSSDVCRCVDVWLTVWSRTWRRKMKDAEATDTCRNVCRQWGSLYVSRPRNVTEYKRLTSNY